MQATRDDDRRDRMLENQLLLIAGLEYDRVLVEGADPPSQLDAADQIDRDVVSFLAGSIEERILNILLCRLRFPSADLLFVLFLRSRPALRTLGRARRSPSCLPAYTIRPYRAVFNTSPVNLRFSDKFAVHRSYRLPGLVTTVILPRWASTIVFLQTSSWNRSLSLE